MPIVPEKPDPSRATEEAVFDAFLAAGSPTGRLNKSEPEQQTIPPRKLSPPPEGYELFKMDFAAAELRIAAAHPNLAAPYGGITDTERVDFHLSADTTWYPGPRPTAMGILCYDSKRYGPRQEVEAPTWREAIDKALELEKKNAM